MVGLRIVGEMSLKYLSTRGTDVILVKRVYIDLRPPEAVLQEKRFHIICVLETIAFNPTMFLGMCMR